MPAHPAITLHSHHSLGATPVPLVAETYLLMQRARMSAENGIHVRWVNTSGRCFLRVDADPRLSWSIDFFTLESLGLANYFPGRNLADQALAFANGATIPFQFSADGIFIYDTVSADDPQGELRAGNVKIDYDLHSGLDTATYPTLEPLVTYVDVALIEDADIPEVVAAMLLLLLRDIFNGEENITGGFTITAYNGDPAGAGAPVGSPVTLEPWTTVSSGASALHALCRNTDAVIWPAALADTGCSHLRLERDGELIADLALTTQITGGAIEADDEVYTKTGHGLSTGDRVLLVSMTGGTGLTAGTAYYFHRLTNNTGHLCATHAAAVAGTPVPVSLDAAAVVLLPTLTINAGEVLRIQAERIGVEFYYSFSGSAGGDETNPARHFIQYICGGDRAFYLAGGSILVAFYEDDPGSSSVAYVDAFSVPASADNFAVETVTLAAAIGDVATDVITSVDHGLATGDSVIYVSGTGFGNPPFIPGTRFYVNVIDDDNFTCHNTYAEALLGTPAVDVNTSGTDGVFQRPAVVTPVNRTLTGVTAEADDDLFSKAAHGLVTGDRVRLTEGTGFTGIPLGDDYWVILITSGTFKLAASYADAVAGTPVDVTLDGTDGVITRAGAAFIGGHSPDDHSLHGVTAEAATDTFTAPSHGLATGDPCSLTEGTGFGGVTPGVTYYAIFVTDGTFKLAASESDAIAGTPVTDVTSDGTDGVVARPGYNATWEIEWVLMTPAGLPVWAVKRQAAIDVDIGDVVALNGEPLHDIGGGP